MHNVEHVTCNMHDATLLAPRGWLYLRPVVRMFGFCLLYVGSCIELCETSCYVCIALLRGDHSVGNC
jgi:hypothetical protein